MSLLCGQDFPNETSGDLAAGQDLVKSSELVGKDFHGTFLVSHTSSKRSEKCTKVV